MRITTCALPIVLCACIAHPETARAALIQQDSTGFELIALDPGEARVGGNTFVARIANRESQPLPFLISVRAESPASAVQAGSYIIVQPGDTVEIRHQYQLPDRSYRLLRAFLGRAESMPTTEMPYPWFASHVTELFAVRPAGAAAAPRFWRPNGATPVEQPAAVARERAAARQALARTLSWDRPAAVDFAAEVVAERHIGGYLLTTVRIATEPDSTVDMLFVRRADATGPRPAVLYLTGNPPGRKESGIAAGMMLADAGLQVIAIDRRESARHTGPGEYLSTKADPVFDARRVVDYLLTRSDVDPEHVGVFGFSAGAAEGMFLAVLHPAVRVAALASRLLEEDSLFQSGAWLPTLYSEDILRDLDLQSRVSDWDALVAAITPDISMRAWDAYRRRYPYFDALDPAEVLPFAAPKPVLLVSGARDEQIMLRGVLALDDVVRSAYDELGVGERAALYVMPRSTHRLTPDGMDVIIDWLHTWLAGE